MADAEYFVNAVQTQDADARAHVCPLAHQERVERGVFHWPLRTPTANCRPSDVANRPREIAAPAEKAPREGEGVGFLQRAIALTAAAQTIALTRPSRLLQAGSRAAPCDLSRSARSGDN
jgi:hypothetical protein